MIKELITTFIAGFLLHLVTTNKRHRKMHLTNFTTAMFYIDNILRTKSGKFIIRSLVCLLLIGTAVFGALVCTIDIMNNKPIWLSLMAPVFSVGAALPLASLVYRQSFE